jgi:ActR/RegA family two-component response regulator
MLWERAGSATEAMSNLKLIGDLEAAIIDIGLPDRKGDVLVSEVRAIYPSMPIVIATGYGEDVLRPRFKRDALR